MTGIQIPAAPDEDFPEIVDEETERMLLNDIDEDLASELNENRT